MPTQPTSTSSSPSTPPSPPAGPALGDLLAGLRRRPWWNTAARVPMLSWRLGLGGVIGRGFAVLTTTGERSGLPRQTMVGCFPAEDPERRYVVALYGPDSQWLRNLQADARVSVQTAGASRAMLARRLTGDQELREAYAQLERRLGPGLELGLRGLGVPGGLEGLLADRDRIALVVLEPTGQTAPPATRADLVWVWPVLGVLWAARRTWRRRRSPNR